MIQQILSPQLNTFNLQKTPVLNYYRFLFCRNFIQNNLYNYIILTSFKGFFIQNIPLLSINYLLQNFPSINKNINTFFTKQVLKKKHPFFFKTLNSLSKKQTPSTHFFKKTINNYFVHRYLNTYQNYFKTKSLPLFSPFIKKKTRHFPFVDNSFKVKALNSPFLGKKFFKNRRHWFLTMISRLKISIYTNSIDKVDSWVVKALKTQRVRRKFTSKKRIYLFPRQYLLLNGPRPSLKKNKPFKILLLRKLIRFYRRNLKRMTPFSKTPFKKNSNKNYKSNFSRSKSSRFSHTFKLNTLWQLTKPIKLNTYKIIRRGKSRKKLIRTRKYFITLYKTFLQTHLCSTFLVNLLNYYMNTRSRYLRRFIRKNTKRSKAKSLIKSWLLSLKKTINPSLQFNGSLRNQFRLKRNLRRSVFFIRRKFTTLNYVINESFPQVTKPELSTMFNVKKIHKISTPSIKPSIWSKYKTSFILSNVGFLFIQPINTSINDLVKSKLNRFRYTFFYQNEIKRFFLRKPGNLKLSFSFLTSPRGGSLSHFSPYKFFNSDLIKSGNPQFESLNLLTKQTQFFKFNYNKKYITSSYNFVKTQVSMRRIKFKPGYSRIWRKAREAINKSLNFNSRYQYSLTRYLNRFSRASKKTSLYLSELTLQKVLINSKLIHDNTTSRLLIDNGLVYVNGHQTSNSNLHLFQNDFIQIIVSLKYYIVQKWLLNWTSFKKIRLIKLSRNKLKKNKNSAYKQKSTNFPDWILESRVKPFDIPKYLEVDFFTLSTFVLYEPFVFNDFNPLNFIESRSTIFNMYNWKYIN